MARLLVPAALVLVAGCSAQAPAAEPDVEVVDAFATASDEVAAVYLIFDNSGGPDRITAAELVGPDAGRAERITMHTTSERDGLSIMESTEAIEIPAGTRTELAPGGSHLMIEGLTDPVAAGEKLRLRLTLDRTGPLDLAADVIPVGDALNRADPATERS